MAYISAICGSILDFKCRHKSIHPLGGLNNALVPNAYKYGKFE